MWSDIHSLNISALAVLRNESLVYTGSRDYSIKGFDIQTSQLVHHFAAPRNVVTFLTLLNNRDDGILVQGAEDLSVRVWDPRCDASGAPIMHLTDYVYFPLCGGMDNSGHLLATGCKGFDGVGCEVKVCEAFVR